MITVTLHLVRNSRVSFACPTSGPLYQKIANLVANLADNRVTNANVLELEIEDSDATRSLAIAAGSVLAVETQPGHVFLAAPPPVMAQTAPYIRIPDFLSKTANKKIMNFALSRAEEFVPSGLASRDGKGSHNTNVRNSFVLSRIEGLPAIFEKNLHKLIPDALEVLEIKVPEKFDVDIQLTTHNDGAFYKLHLDNNLPSLSGRKMTFVYYFNQEPVGFSGGDICLFDSIPETDEIADTFVDIAPDNNTLLLFPSQIPHEVREICCPSNKFADGRFTLNGWVSFE